MAVTMRDLGIDKLADADHIALAIEIWESLDFRRLSAGLSPGQVEELGRRDAELDADPGSALTWEQIRAEVEAGS